MPNIERLTALLEYVEKLPPEKIHMGSYFCGTAACLMGHACDVFPETFKRTGVHGVDSGIKEEFPGMEFFELNSYQWRAIFSL